MTSAVPDLPYPSARAGWRMVAILLVASMFSYLDRAIITLLLPMIRADLGVSDTQFSLLQGLAFAITFAVAGIPMGWLADHRSRSRLIAIGVASWSVATVFCGLADTFWELFIARMGVGIGEACLAPAAVSLIADSFPRERRGRVLGVMQVGTPLGSGLAKVVGGLTLAAVGGTALSQLPLLSGLAPWQVVFVVVGAPGLLVALLCLTIREPARRERTAPRLGSGHGLRRYLADHGRTVVPVVATYTLVTACGFVNTSWSPVIFMRRFGLSPAETGVVIGATVTIAGVCAALAGGVMSDAYVRRHPRDGRLRMAVALLPLIVVSFLVIALSPSYPVTLVAYAAASFLTFAVTSSGPAALQEIAPNEQRGQLISINVLISNVVGLGLAPTLVALVTDYGFADDAMLPYSVGLVTAPAALAAILTTWLALPAYRRTRDAVAEDAARQAAASPEPKVGAGRLVAG